MRFSSDAFRLDSWRDGQYHTEALPPKKFEADAKSKSKAASVPKVLLPALLSQTIGLRDNSGFLGGANHSLLASCP